MPYHQFALPVSATNLAVDHKNQSYPLLLDTDTFDRTGEDGDIPILPINGGDEYVGEAVEGHWHKGWDGNISTFCATINGGTLRLTGVAAVAGTGGNGWVNSHHPAPLLDELEYTFSLEVPVDDTGTTASRDIKLAHFIKQDKDELQPDSDNNFLQIEVDVDENGLIMYVRKEVNGTNTTLDSGYDYTMDGSRSTGNLEATIWRLVFNEKPGTTGASVSIYLKQGATLATAEAATENELDGSPYDISDLAFNVGYPSYRIYTENTTYFGTAYNSANRAASTYLRLDYPSQFDVNYDWTEADYGKGQVELYDGDPDSGGIRVYDEDHEFANDPYLQNGLVRIHVDDGAQHGLVFYGYIGGSWEQLTTLYYPRLDVSNTNLQHTFFKSIEYLSPEKVILKLKNTNSSTDNDDYYTLYNLTLKRGLYSVLYEPTIIYPIEPIEAQYLDKETDSRFKYIGDCGIADEDLAVTATNTTLTDNFGVVEDNSGDAVILSASTNKNDLGSFSGDGTHLRMNEIQPSAYAGAQFVIGVSPFSLVANLFKEAEDASLNAGATAAADGAASGGQAALLNAQNENVEYHLTAGTDLPSGRYCAVFRIRDTNQVVGDPRIRVWNLTDTDWRNEESIYVSLTVTATYAYYCTFFDITDADVSDGDSIRIRCIKILADANDIYVDYFLIIPIGNGMNWPQDLSHGALRGITQHPRLSER